VISAGLSVHATGGMRATDVSFSIASPSGKRLIHGTINTHGTIMENGWHAVHVEAGKEATGSAAFELTVTYSGTGSL
jgi:hypothetical protein